MAYELRRPVAAFGNAMVYGGYVPFTQYLYRAVGVWVVSEKLLDPLTVYYSGNSGACLQFGNTIDIANAAESQNGGATWAEGGVAGGYTSYNKIRSGVYGLNNEGAIYLAAAGHNHISRVSQGALTGARLVEVKDPSPYGTYMYLPFAYDIEENGTIHIISGTSPLPTTEPHGRRRYRCFQQQQTFPATNPSPPMAEPTPATICTLRGVQFMVEGIRSR